MKRWMNFLWGIILAHAIVWIGVGTFMIIWWKFLQPNTLMIWERIALLLSIIMGAMAYGWEALDGI